MCVSKQIELLMPNDFPKKRLFYTKRNYLLEY